LLLGIVYVLVAIGEDVAELAGVAIELTAPPGARVADGREGCLGTLINRE
jgi:hypothetical protein